MALTNNDIIKKLRVALKLRDEDIVDILKLADYTITKSELGAFFRNPDHPKFMPLQDQILRYFLNGLVTARRGPMEKKESSDGKTKSHGLSHNKISDRNRPESQYPKPKGPKSTFKPKRKSDEESKSSSEKKAPFKKRLSGKIERRKK